MIRRTRNARRSFAAAGALVLALGAGAHAQQRIVALNGAVLRVHGDTAAYERDTTALVEVDRRDTIAQARIVNGRTVTTIEYLVHGDSAQPVRTRAGDGPWTNSASRVVSKRSAAIVRSMVEREREQSALREQLAREHPDKPVRLPEPPARPASPQTYVLWSRVRLLQHLDTVKRVRDCPDREHPDTTVFVFYHADSVKRVRPDPRRFGFVMQQTLIGEMRASMTRVASGTPLSIEDRVPHPGDMACPPAR